MPSIYVQDTTSYGTRVVIDGLTYAANTYDWFEVEIWDYSNTIYSGSLVRWSESLTGNYAWTDIAGLIPNTGYTFKGFLKWQGGTRNHVGNVSFTTLTTGGGTDPEPGPTRPSNWSWSTLVSSASVYSTAGTLRANVVSATEWNDFCSRINEFRQYKNLASYSFSQGTSSNSLTSSKVMEAINAINTMTPVSMGSGPYSTLINLANALNSIS